MANSVEKPQNNPPLTSHKLMFISQIALRVFAFATTLSAAWLMLTAKQTSIVFGIEAHARYSYSPALKYGFLLISHSLHRRDSFFLTLLKCTNCRFFAYANLIVCAFTIMTLFLAFTLGKKAVDPTYYFYIFLLDLVIPFII